MCQALVGHDHLHQHIAGEDLALHLFGPVVRDLGDGLQGDADLVDQILKTAVLHVLLNGGLHGIFIAGIGVDHIPLRAVSHIRHLSAEQAEQELDQSAGHRVKEPDEDAHHDDAEDDDPGVVHRLLEAGPLRPSSARSSCP